MAFCTACGANVTGAFCNQCGAPAPGTAGGVAGGAGAPPVPPGGNPGNYPPQGAVPPAYARAFPTRRTSPLIWILVAIGGFLLLCVIGVIATGLFVVHKARQAGFDSALMSRNPGLAISKMVAAANPDAEVLSTDDGAGTITVRDRHTGKVVTLKFDDVKNGTFSMTTLGDDGKTASIQVGGAAGKLPSWVPEYPRSSATGTFSVKGGGAGEDEAESVSFKTSDAPATVMSFYQDKLKNNGMKVNLATTTSEGGMIVAVDDSEKRSITVIVGGGGSGQTSVSLTYGRKG